MSTPAATRPGRLERGGKPKTGSPVYRFYARVAAAGEPTPLAIMPDSTHVGASGETDPVAGADTSMFDPTATALIPAGVTLPAGDGVFPTLAHAYVHLRATCPGYPVTVRDPLRAMSLDELQKALRKKDWGARLYAHRADADIADVARRGWSKARWVKQWYEQTLPRWYRRSTDAPDDHRTTRAYQAWKAVVQAAAAQNPPFAAALCSTGTRELALRRAFFANPRKRATIPHHGETDDIITADGQTGVYGLALMDVRDAYRSHTPALAALPDAYEPYANAPHTTAASSSASEGDESAPVPAPAPAPAPAPVPTASPRRREPASANAYEPSSVSEDTVLGAANGADDDDDDDDDDDMDVSEPAEPRVLTVREEAAESQIVAQLPRAQDGCTGCGRDDARVICSACLQRAYCSYACQRAHWRDQHHRECASLVPQRPPVRLVQ